MNFFRNNKKPGFTLMEIALAVLIIAILALALVPVINNQLRKSDEYSYYMAYRTIEKLGGQIVALGDEEDTARLDDGTRIAHTKIDPVVITEKSKNKKFVLTPAKRVKFFFANLGAKFAYSEQYLFRKLFPKSYAGTQTRAIFDGEGYNMYSITLQYCAGKDVCDPDESNKDWYKKECDGNGYNCVVKAKCDRNKSNCCNSEKLNLADAPSCNPNYVFKQKYKKCTTVKTKTTCEVDEEGNKVDPDCKEEWQETETCEDNLDSCSTYTSQPNTTITCTPTNKYKEDYGCHILRPVDVEQYVRSAEGLTDCPTDEEARDYVDGFFSDDSCILVEDPTGTMSESAYMNAVKNILDSMVTAIENGTYASAFCRSYVRSYCRAPEGDTSTYNVDYKDGGCNLYISSNNEDSGIVNNDESWVRPTVDNICVPAYGYYNMQNAGGSAGNGKYYSTNCVCKSGYPYIAANNSKVCCPQPDTPDSTVYATAYNTCISCATDFNPHTNTCCPEHSVFNGSTSCECVEGYTAQGSGAGMWCKLTSCAKGSHLDEENEVCVPNVPIIKAKRLCEKIADNWNIISSSCNGFTDTKYNTSVFNAAKGTDNQYLSIKSKDGAFSRLTPHITFTNGLRLWILGNKMASIPGLSYNPTSISDTQNICRDITNVGGANQKTTPTTCKATSGEYLCRGEKHCFTMDSNSLNKMGDARNCCSSSDVTDLLGGDPEKDNRAFAINGFTVFVDINGEKGAGTLWEDVFPFYVSANGRVYPGYPLNADKSKTSASTSLYTAGNSSTMLPTDVYYYETDINTDRRQRYIAYPNVSFARAACEARWIGKNTPYCLNLGKKYKDINGTNPCDSHKCFVSVRNKLRMF